VRRLTVNLSVTLDGVVQAPGRPDEDRRGAFDHGGWAVPYFDAVMAAAAGEGMASTPALLFGRRTYEDFFSVWPNRKDNPFTEVLNRSDKYVVSRSLEEPLPWEHSVLLRGEAATTVAALKAQPGKDLAVLGSASLVRDLMACDLIDEYALSIHPVALGSGQRLFPDRGPLLTLRLIGTTTSTTGVVMTRYAPIRDAARAA